MRRVGCVLAIGLLAGGCGGSSNGDLEKDTKTLRLGERTELKGASGTYRIALEVDAEQGRPGDLRTFRLEAAEKKMTPWYVTTRVTNLGKKPLTQKDAVTAGVDAIDSEGKEAKQIGLIGEFPRCELTNLPDPFEPQETVESCEVFLVAPGRTLAKLVHLETRFDQRNLEVSWKVG